MWTYQDKMWGQKKEINSIIPQERSFPQGSNIKKKMWNCYFLKNWCDDQNQPQRQWVFKNICLFLLERQSFREERQREKNFHLLVYSLDDHNDQSWVDPKSQSRSYFWVFPVGSGSQSFGQASSACQLDRKYSWDKSWCLYGIPMLARGVLATESLQSAPK